MRKQRAADRPGLRSIRRVVRKQIDRANEGLTHGARLSDRTVHDARKRLKKARAGLRMLRGELGRASYRNQNRALRDAARPLSTVRDASILVEVFDRLFKRAAAGERRRVKDVRAILLADRAQARARLRSGTTSLDATLASLQRAKLLTKSWPSAGGSWKRLRPGLLRTYRAGREAMHAARGRPTDANLHEWRKQAKYLWLQMQMVESLRPAVIARKSREVHRLSEQLGDDHDLAVLLLRIRRAGQRIPADTVEIISTLVEARRARLQSKAARLGTLVYGARAKELGAQLDAFARRKGDSPS